MELLLLENEQLKERLRLMQAAEERAKATIAEYIYECDREKEDYQQKIKDFKDLIFKLTTEVNLSRKKEPDDGTGLQLDEQGEIKAGTAEKLVASLYLDNFSQASTAATAEYSQIFLLTYRSFATGQQVLELLIQGYNMLVVDPNPNAKTCRLKIGNFLKKWMTDNYHDFINDQELLERYTFFVNTIISKSEPTLASSLKGSMAQRLKGGAPLRSSSVAMFTDPPPKPYLPRTTPTSVLDIHPKELARQLTLMHYNLCKAIEAKECLGMAWTRKDKEQRAPNLLRMIHNFNTVSKWVAASIVKETAMAKRVAILSHFIHVVEHLRELNNFNAVFQIIGGLGNSSVFRLTKTFARLKAERNKVLEESRILTNPHKSWSNYRKTIHEINPPCVPFLGIYQTDLTFIEDGNPDKFSTGLINFKKCRLVASVIAEIQQYQHKPYNLQGVPVIEEWILKDQEANQLDEKQLYDLSLLAEPRGA